MKTYIAFTLLIFLPMTLLASEESVPHIKDFTLQSVADQPTKTFTLSEHRGKHVILHFLLKTTCPVCRLHTRNYYEKLAGNDQVIQLFIKPDEVKQIEQWIAGLDDRPTIYHDPDASLAQKYAVPNGYHFHGQIVHYPACIILDTKGKEIFRYVGKSNGDRFKFESFAKKYPHLLKQ
ncbi:MAG: TlpA family protein disulfide reductase [Planctomycetes bacterium]|nr:TlpA family protein disulfide reductase [Planctomycetota bacterium]